MAPLAVTPHALIMRMVCERLGGRESITSNDSDGMTDMRMGQTGGFTRYLPERLNLASFTSYSDAHITSFMSYDSDQHMPFLQHINGYCPMLSPPILYLA